MVLGQYFSHISAMQTWGYYIKLDEIYGDILLICQNITMRVYTEHEFKDIAFYVKKNL